MSVIPAQNDFNLLSLADTSRKNAIKQIDLRNRAECGQYMTPASVASFMASLLPILSGKRIRLLDPGAGTGSLTSAFIERLAMTEKSINIDVTAYELDVRLCSYLRENLLLCQNAIAKKGGEMSWNIEPKDFIKETSQELFEGERSLPSQGEKFTHCIMNPPYKKLRSSSPQQANLKSIGIQTVNLYSAFVALALLSLQNSGYLVAIIPRSFCNGLYYRPFRKLILDHSAIRRIHLFGSRSSAFKEDGVLQENIILMLEKNGKQEEVTVSHSTDDSFSDMTVYNCSFNDIVVHGNEELFIHIPSSDKSMNSKQCSEFRNSLSDIDLQVSTGPVVDFRLKEHLRDLPNEETAPLLYPCNFDNGEIKWPIVGSKKPNAIIDNEKTLKWLYPSGFYVIVRRFSSKEEKKRIVASLVDPSRLGKNKKIGFENHLNVFHFKKKPIPEDLARGLVIFLASTSVDVAFRLFSGHTQVNVTDLKLMKYPSRENLIALGIWAKTKTSFTQEMIDKKVGSLLK